jgi:hypothetical protein
MFMHAIKEAKGMPPVACSAHVLRIPMALHRTVCTDKAVCIVICTCIIKGRIRASRNAAVAEPLWWEQSRVVGHTG